MIDDVGCSRRHQCPQCDVVLLYCLHYFRFISALLSSSATFVMVLVPVFSLSTSFWNISLYSMFARIDLLLPGMFGGCVPGFPCHFCRICTGQFCIIFYSCFSPAALGCSCPHYCRALFPVQFFHLVWSLAYCNISFEVFPVFSTFSFSIRSKTWVFISSWRFLFRLALDNTVIWSLTLNSSAILLISLPHSLLFGEVTSLMRAPPFMLSIRLAWRIFFFFMISSMS